MIDKQYAEVIKYAEILTPSQLQISPKILIKFQKKYHVSWIEALSENDCGVYNAIEFMKKFKLTSEELYKLWIDSATSGRIISFSSYFYCGQIELVQPCDGENVFKNKIFCINGFFPYMKEKYFRLTSNKLYYMCLEWDNNVIN